MRNFTGKLALTTLDYRELNMEPQRTTLDITDIERALDSPTYRMSVHVYAILEGNTIIIRLSNMQGSFDIQIMDTFPGSRFMYPIWDTRTCMRRDENISTGAGQTTLVKKGQSFGVIVAPEIGMYVKLIYANTTSGVTLQAAAIYNLNCGSKQSNLGIINFDLVNGHEVLLAYGNNIKAFREDWNLDDFLCTGMYPKEEHSILTRIQPSSIYCDEVLSESDTEDLDTSDISTADMSADSTDIEIQEFGSFLGDFSLDSSFGDLAEESMEINCINAFTEVGEQSFDDLCAACLNFGITESF